LDGLDVRASADRERRGGVPEVVERDVFREERIRSSGLLACAGEPAVASVRGALVIEAPTKQDLIARTSNDKRLELGGQEARNGDAAHLVGLRRTNDDLAADGNSVLAHGYSPAVEVDVPNAKSGCFAPAQT
jgi:hypothetical protein